MGARSKAVGKVADTFGKVSDNRVARKRISDAGNASQRRLNERAQDKSFFHCGWRPALGWACVSVLIAHFLIYPFVMMIFPDVREPHFDIETIMGILSTLLGVNVIARSVDKAGRSGIFARMRARRK